MREIYRHRTARSDELIGYVDESGVVFDTRLDKEKAVGRVELDSGKVYFTRFDLDEYVGKVNLEDGKVYRHKPGPDDYVGRVDKEGKLYRHKSLSADDYLGSIKTMVSVAEGAAAMLLLFLEEGD